MLPKFIFSNFNFEQPLNKYPISFTFSKLKFEKSTDVKLEQSPIKLYIYVNCGVSIFPKLIFSNFEHPENNESISSTSEKSKNDISKDVKLEQPSNKP